MKKFFMLLIVGFCLCFASCNLDNLNLDNSTTTVIVEEVVDAFGFTLGMLAAKDPILKDKIEEYYIQLINQGLTLTLINQALNYLGNENFAYKLLAYKMIKIIKTVGGKFDDNGMITDLGKLTQEHLEIGKQAYLFALVSAGAGD